MENCCCWCLFAYYSHKQQLQFPIIANNLASPCPGPENILFVFVTVRNTIGSVYNGSVCILSFYVQPIFFLGGGLNIHYDINLEGTLGVKKNLISKKKKFGKGGA